MELPTVMAPPTPTPPSTITAIEASVEVTTALEALMAIQFVALLPLMLAYSAAVAIAVMLLALMISEVLPLAPLVMILRVSLFASAKQERRANCERNHGAFQ
jgi:hypothetical protein